MPETTDAEELSPWSFSATRIVSVPPMPDRTTEALRQANEISRRAEKLLAVAPKVRTKGAGVVIQKLLEEEAVQAAAPGSTLSR